MDDRLDYKILITPQEAIILVERRPVEDVYICTEIEREFDKRNGQLESALRHALLMTAIWNGGRIQGIREERRRKAGTV